MTGAGEKPVDQFKRVPKGDGEVFTPKALNGDEKPTYKGISYTSGDNVDSVILQPVNEKGEKVGEPTTVPVGKTDKPTTATLRNPEQSDSLEVTFVPKRNGETPDAVVTSIIACMKEDG